jgi:hypothetical protein
MAEIFPDLTFVPTSMRGEPSFDDDTECKRARRCWNVDFNRSHRYGDGHNFVFHVGAAHKPKRYFSAASEIDF